MQGVGTGRVIAGRYGLQERRAHQGELEVWSGTDTIARRPVSITIFPVTLPRADAALDAARRSAVVDDPRLVAVLDVGSDHGMAWIVEESLNDSATMANLLQCGPLGADESRRIAGEIASALDVAGRRGLHHLHLSPYAVRRTSDGRIKLAGLATAAAIEGTEESDPARAALEDTRGVLAVLYAGLTARWPFGSQMPGLAAAPRIVGGVAAPSELTAGIPADLDLLCRTVLNGQPGPVTPGELAAQIAPWANGAVDATAPHSRSQDVGTAPLLPLEPGPEPTAVPVAEPPAAPSTTPSPVPSAVQRSAAEPASATSPSPAPDAPTTQPIRPTGDVGEPPSPESDEARSGPSTLATATATAAVAATGAVGAAASAADAEGGATVGDRLSGAWRTAVAKTAVLRARHAEAQGPTAGRIIRSTCVAGRGTRRRPRHAAAPADPDRLAADPAS